MAESICLRVGAGSYTMWDMAYMASMDANESSKDTSTDVVTRCIPSRLVEAWETAEIEDGVTRSANVLEQ